MSWQKVKAFLKPIVNHPYVKPPLVATAITLSAILLFFLFLHVFSRHGRGFPVPDFAGLTIENAQKLANQKRLRLEITDSLYITTKQPGSVLEQTPSAGTFVKANRRIFITTNAKNPTLVEVPNLVGLTLRQAKSTLQLLGFKIGVLAFTPDIAVNNVLDQHYRGKPIAPLTSIAKGSAIDLLLGMGLNNEQTVLPRVIGLTLAEARNLLHDASLNLGKYSFDATVIDEVDSLQARVYSQYPAHDPNNQVQIRFGARVELWLTQNESRIPKEVIPEYKKENSQIDTIQPEEEIFE